MQLAYTTLHHTLNKYIIYLHSLLVILNACCVKNIRQNFKLYFICFLWYQKFLTKDAVAIQHRFMFVIKNLFLQ
ncbi:hypothetical protein ES20_03295 [Rothia aeria]|nr:hypothetical protein ES20_03295 [Rothia aeria]KGJ31945.1 hypothetical protein ES18_10920 [Rothia aeria]